uniref:Uncharacterized protein n=1 Tax=Timema poppense TaxID=170557 RepID=A0A7R9DHG8_TIMPO|nr:unnamed protein product [Timema poppensis]
MPEKAISSLMTLFQEDYKSVAMMKHGLKLMKPKTEYQYLNAGQQPVITMEQPLALAKAILEKLSHTNVTFSENSTMTYVARRTAIFQPELNHLSLNDTLVLPNIGVLANTCPTRYTALTHDTQTPDSSTFSLVTVAHSLDSHTIHCADPRYTITGLTDLLARHGGSLTGLAHDTLR